MSVTGKIKNLDEFDTQEQVFEAVKWLIWKACADFKRRNGGDVEEYFAESCYWFLVSILPKYSPDRGKSFSGWTYQRVINHLQDVTRRGYQKNEILPRTFDVTLDQMESRPEFDLRWFKKSVSRDAAVLVHMVTQVSTGNLYKELTRAGFTAHSSKARQKKPNPKLVKRVVWQELRKTWEWEPNRVLKAFCEVRSALAPC